MKNYWWIVSVLKIGFVGGAGVDDDTYTFKNREVYKVYGSYNEQTRAKLISEIPLKRSSEIEFVWCLSENGEEKPSLAGSLKKFLEKKLRLINNR